MLDQKLIYASDQIRAHLIAAAINSPAVPEQIVTNDDLWETEDLTLVLNHRDYLSYSELWVKGCWEGMKEKTEYKTLSRYDALLKFTKERLSRVAALNGLKIKTYRIECEEGYDIDDEEADWLLIARLDFC